MGRIRILAHRRSLQYLGLLLLLVIAAVTMAPLPLRGSLVTRALAETLAANLAVLTALVALLRYSASRDSLFLCAAMGLMGASVLDGLQALGAVRMLTDNAALAHAAPASAARILVPLCLWLGVWISDRDQRLSRMALPTETILAAGAGLTMLCVVWIVAAPRTISASGLLAHVTSSICYFGAARMLLRRRVWTSDSFEHFLMLSLIVGFAGNTLFLTNAREVSDGMFMVFLHLKNTSYLLVLIGMVVGMVQLFRSAETSASSVAAENCALKCQCAEIQRLRELAEEAALAFEQRAEQQSMQLADTEQIILRVRQEAAQQHFADQRANRQLRIEIDRLNGIEHALRESERRLQLALSAGQIGIWTWDAARDHAIWDDQVCRILGRQDEGLTSSFRSLLEMIHPDEVDTVREAVSRAAEDAGEFDIAYRVIHPDGCVRHVVSRAAHTREEATGRSQMTGTMIDVTEYRRGETVLIERTEELGRMIRITGCLYGIANLLERSDSRLEEICERIIELLPLGWRDPENTFARLELAGCEYGSPGSHQGEVGHSVEISLDGESIGRIELVHAAPEPDPSGFRREEIKAIEVVASGLSRVIAERRGLERLRRSEQRYRNLFEQMTEACVLCEVLVNEMGKAIDYRFLEINTEFQRASGLRAERTIGRPMREVMPESEPQWLEILGQVALTREPAQFEGYSRLLGRSVSAAAFSPEAGRVAVVFR